MTDRTRLPVFRVLLASVLALALVFSLAACASQPDAATDAPEGEVGDSATEPTRIILASTTSTQDSGLFDDLIPAFEAAYPEYAVEVIAVGTGEALEMGRNKDADVLLVHAKADEETFVAEGYGAERRDVCYNDFVFVGAEGDPAGIGAAADLNASMTAIASGKAPYVSRGDDSGTHKKEKKLFEAAGIQPAGDWYLVSGQGMGETLKIASEKQGYTLSDRATYLSMLEALDLAIVREGDAGLLNQYGVIPVTDARNADGAQAFMDWVTSAEGQAVIGAYGVEKFGAPLFFPNAE
ncbi:MAG: extracellular solute-binding protein [Actinomycetota bacterium]|nr:extracellular solute-binding protein [Actinomycetota bacterium]